MDRVLVDARCLRPGAHPCGAEAARDRSELLRRDLHHACRRVGAASPHQRRGLRRGTLLLAGRHADRLAAVRHAGVDRGRLDHETRRQRRTAGHELWLDELGPVHPPVRGIPPVRIEQARFRELRGLHGGRRGTKGTGTRDILRRLRRPARALTRWPAARVDVEPGRRTRGPAVPRRLEPRPRSCHAACGAESEPDSMTRITALLLLCLSATADAQAPVTSKTRAHVEFLASEALEGREAGSPGERLAADYLAAQLARMGARPLPGRADMFMPFEFTAGSRDGGSHIHITATSGTSPAPQTREFA